MDVYRSELLSSFPKLRHGFVSRINPQKFPRLLKDSGLTFIQTAKQMHQDRILKISNEEMVNIEGDSLYTDERNVGVGVYSADCLPIIYFEDQRRVVGAIHAGWRGTLKKITAKTFTYICKELNCDSSRVNVAIGPCIDAKCYEIGEEVANQFKKEFDNYELFLTKKDSDKYQLDLKKANIHQMRSVGINSISILEECTFCDLNLPSYRRDGKNTERILSFIGMVG